MLPTSSAFVYPRSLRAVAGEVFPPPSDLSRGITFAPLAGAITNDDVLRNDVLNRKKREMIIIALSLAWLAVVAVAVIARADYRPRRVRR